MVGVLVIATPAPLVGNPPYAPRLLAPDASRAVGRFQPGGPIGYRAATLPDAPLRGTREEARADELAWREGRWRPVGYLCEARS